MTTITVTKADGSIDGMTPKDRRAYRRFLKKLEHMEEGELFTLAVEFPRFGPFHRKHMKMVTTFFAHQEQFDDDTQFRYWLHVGAGHCTWAPGPDGQLVPIPGSIAYTRMEDQDFREHHEAVKAFLRGDRAQGFLWPHLSERERADMVETILEGFERTP